MKNRLQCWIVCAILCFTVNATAQVSTGTPVMGSFSSGPDVINLGNLNVHFAIPVFSKPGRGTPFDYVLSFDSSVWTPVTVSGTKSWQPDPNWGWRAITEAATGYISRQRNTVQCLLDSGEEYIPPRPPRYGNFPQWTNYQYHDAFGVNHAGFANIVGGCVGDTDPSDSVSTDAAGWTLDTSSGAKLTTPQGTIYNSPVDLANGAATVTDRNGNQITTTSGSTFSDTLGMTALSVTGGAPSPLTMTYTTTTGAPASVTVTYTPMTVQTAFSCSGVAEYGPTPSVPLVSSVTLPDGSSYLFQYEVTPGHSPNVTGRVSSITLRTGGTISYVYTGGSNGIECADGSAAGLNRATIDGTMGYSRTGSGTAWVTTIMDANSTPNETDITFQAAGAPANFYETHRRIYQGPATSGTDLLDIDTCYNTTVEPNCSTTSPTLPIAEIKRYTVLPSGAQSLTDTKLNTFGLTTEVDEYDFGTSPHGALQRKSLITYATLGNGIIGLPSAVTVQDGSGNQKSQHSFGYDQTAVGATSGVPQHTSITGSRGNQTTITEWVSSTATSLVATMTYDDTGNMLTSTDPSGNQTLYSYLDNFSDLVSRGSNAYLTKITEPATGGITHISATQYDANTGRSASMWNLNNLATTYTYDALLRPLTINFPDGGQTAYVYNSVLSTTQNRKLSASQVLSSTAILDGLGRLSQSQFTSDPSGTTTTEITYNSNGQQSSVSNPHRAGSSPTDGTMHFTYDGLGRMLTETKQDGNQTSNSYANNCVTATDESAKKKMSCVDSLGRVISTWEPDGTGSLTWETDTTYDALNNVTSITQKGGSTNSSLWRVRNFSYDGTSRPTEIITPESGDTKYFYTTASGALCAGHFSLPCRITDARSVTKTYSYDALNRLTGKSYSDGTPAVTYSFDQTSFNGLAIANGNGLRTGMTDNSGSTAWSYDAMGRIINRLQTISGVSKGVTYSYNLDGSLSGMTYPSGRTYSYSYNSVGEVTSVADNTHGINFFSSGLYAPPGLLASAIYGATTGWNAITLTNSYNSRLQPTQILAVSPLPSTLLNLTYSYDQGGGVNNGRVVQIANGRDSTRSVAYTYDQLNRLSAARTYSATTWGNSYVYDAWGNLLQKNVTQGTAENMVLTVNNKNQITSPAFSYDAAGNVTSDTTSLLSFDGDNHLNPTSGTTYTYDGDGHRVKKSDGTVYWFDDNRRPLSIGTTSGSMTKDFVFVGSKRLAFVSLASGNPYYYLSDHLGSTAVIASGDGKTIQWEADYFPFGAQRTIITANVNNPYQFTGYEYDSDTSYNYADARHEAGRWGRFMSPDPYLGSMQLSNPQSLNRYSYVNNDTVNSIDRSGMMTGKFTCELLDSGDCRGGDYVSSVTNPMGAWGDPFGPMVDPTAWNPMADAERDSNPFQLEFVGTLYGKSYDQTFSSWSALFDWMTGIAALPESQEFAANQAYEQQRNAVAAALGVSPSEFSKSDSTLHGGNWNFVVPADATLPSDCNSDRCGYYPSLHFAADGSTVHLDTANPLVDLGSLLTHFFVDVFAGNTFLSGGIPR